MKDLIASAHIEPDTRFRVSSYPDRSRPFVSLRIEGDCTEIALLAAGTSEALRNLAAAANKAASALDIMTTGAGEATE